MLLERLGKFCFSQKRPLFFYCALALPVFIGSFYSFLQYKKIMNLEERFETACKKGKTALMRKKKREYFIQRYTNANPYFLDEHIESLTFLGEEIRTLETLIQHPAIADKRPLEARLDFLTEGQNRLSFTEEAIRSSTFVKETEEKQRHPVQMNGEDLKKLLSLVEDLPIESSSVYEGQEHRPQIIITDFRLETKQTPLKTNVFEVEMQFLKREFIQ